jgi:hypothetical protein
LSITREVDEDDVESTSVHRRQIHSDEA